MLAKARDDEPNEAFPRIIMRHPTHGGTVQHRYWSIVVAAAGLAGLSSEFIIFSRGDGGHVKLDQSNLAYSANIGI